MIEVTPYIGREFRLGSSDCYGLVRDVYRDVYNIRLPNYARPNAFWTEGWAMYADRFEKHGFRPVHGHASEWREGDVALMAVRAEVANHAAILLGDGTMLHHLFGRLSVVETYRGRWRDMTLALVRHPDVEIREMVRTMPITDLVPANIQKKVRDAGLA